MKHPCDLNIHKQEMNEQSVRFMRQLLLQRYKTILDKLQSLYNLSDTQMAALREKVLNIQWMNVVRDYSPHK